MDDMTATTTLIAQLGEATARSDKARQLLANRLEFGGVPLATLSNLMGDVLSAEAHAKPWVVLMARINALGCREGLAKVRTDLTHLLLTQGPTLSTSVMLNAAQAAEHDGWRQFLSDTEDINIDADTAPTSETIADH